MLPNLFIIKGSAVLLFYQVVGNAAINIISTFQSGFASLDSTQPRAGTVSS